MLTPSPGSRINDENRALLLSRRPARLSQSRRSFEREMTNFKFKMAASTTQPRALRSNLASMRTEEEIYRYLQSVLVELFEVDPARITREATLHEDLDIDSVDAVDLVLKLKEITGRKIQPEDFRHVRTVNDVVHAVQAMLGQAARAERN